VGRCSGLRARSQVTPKRCGHFDGKEIVPPEEMVRKIVAALRTRRDPDLVLIVRTGAVAVEGLASAIERAQLYASAGADVIFVEALETVEDIVAVPKAVPVPCLINLVPGGKTPLLTVSNLGSMGYKFVLYANLALQVATRSVEEALAVLWRDGTAAGLAGAIMSWDRRQELVGLAEWEALDASIAREARRIVADHGLG
jgi:2-methylisocitrate lyase-like PEP mutase family enzyme